MEGIIINRPIKLQKVADVINKVLAEKPDALLSMGCGDAITLGITKNGDLSYMDSLVHGIDNIGTPDDVRAFYRIPFVNIHHEDETDEGVGIDGDYVYHKCENVSDMEIFFRDPSELLHYERQGYTFAIYGVDKSNLDTANCVYIITAETSSDRERELVGCVIDTDDRREHVNRWADSYLLSFSTIHAAWDCVRATTIQPLIRVTTAVKAVYAAYTYAYADCVIGYSFLQMDLSPAIEEDENMKAFVELIRTDEDEDPLAYLGYVRDSKGRVRVMYGSRLLDVGAINAAFGPDLATRKTDDEIIQMWVARAKLDAEIPEDDLASRNIVYADGVACTRTSCLVGDGYIPAVRRMIDAITLPIYDDTAEDDDDDDDDISIGAALHDLFDLDGDEDD